jgi:flagellar protein FlgJ
MSIPVNSGDIYTDVSSLRNLKRDAATGSQAALEKTAEQFEAMFLQMMLKSMRQAAPSDGMFDSDQTRFYQDMFDQQISIDMAKKRQLGIADMLVKQLGKEQGAVAEPVKGLMLDIERLRLAQPVTAATSVESVPATTPVTAPETVPEIASGEKITGFTSHADFVEKLYPLAEKYGAELGVDPKVLLAQAALETGWGKSVSRDANGVSSHNLFNIKADKRWSGEQTVVTTLEYENGKAVRQQAAFRAYPDFEASFRDYAAFLKSSPRYQPALAQADDGPAFVRALHEAGYATDPKYSDKINAILARLEA